MGGKLDVNTVKIKDEVIQFERCAVSLRVQNQKIREIFYASYMSGDVYYRIRGVLKRVLQQLDDEAKDAAQLGNCLDLIVREYEMAERVILQNIHTPLPVNTGTGEEKLPDYAYAQEVQRILEKLQGKDCDRLEMLKYLYELLKRASFNDPKNCTLTKAEKEALLRWIGSKMDGVGEKGVKGVRLLEVFFSNDEVAKLFNSDQFNEAEREGISLVAGSLAALLGFTYNEKTDSYYTREGCIQQQWGFCDAIDDWGPALGMDLDTDVKTFTYDGQEFRVQLWKGLYGGGGAVGSEFAIYSRSETEAMANPYEWGNENSRYVLYDSVEDKYQPAVTQKTMYKDSKGRSEKFSCDTKEYGDGDDYWNLNIRTDAGARKNTIVSTYTIDCSKQGEGFAQAMEEAFKNDPNLSKEPIIEGNVIILEY